MGVDLSEEAVAYAAWPYEAPELEYEVGDVSNLLAPAGTLLRVALAVSGAIGDPLILLVLLALWITAPIRQRNQARATIVSNETLLLANDAQALGDEMRAIHRAAKAHEITRGLFDEEARWRRRRPTN